MAYLGNAPARSFISFERQVFTIVNSQTAYTLDHSVNNENDIRLVINNIVQEPGSGKAYTASGTTLTLSAALTNGTDEMYCVFLGRAVATNKPGAGSVGTTELAADAVTEAKIADDAVESEHLNDNVISGQTELAAEPADTDEFLVSDAGTLKRIDYSYIKASPAMELLASADADNSATKASFDGFFSSTYKNYKLIGSNITIASGQSALRVRFRRSNSEISTSNYYAVGVRYYIVDGSITAVGHTGQSSGLLVNENTARTDGYNSSFTLDLYDPLGTNNYKNATFICTGFDTGTNDNRHHFETGALGLTDSTSALSGITIDQAGGVNIFRGNFKLYGIK